MNRTNQNFNRLNYPTCHLAVHNVDGNINGSKEKEKENDPKPSPKPGEIREVPEVNPTDIPIREDEGTKPKIEEAKAQYAFFEGKWKKEGIKNSTPEIYHSVPLDKFNTLEENY